VTTTPHAPPPHRDWAPQLGFAVESAEPLAYAAVPTLRFGLVVDAPGEQAIRSVLLDVQIQIAARRRGYGSEAQERLLELFGTPERWASTLRTLPWTRTTLVIPPFTGRTTVDLAVPCTYDLEVSATRYLAALDDGEVPLEFLLSGSVFYAGANGALQTARIAWDHEVEYRLPVAAWRRTMDQHFPDSAWLRVRRHSFQRLCAYKARHAFATWEDAIEALLGSAGER
jgi:Family of unknown function (DUF6084)